jgi:hypothetical protein
MKFATSLSVALTLTLSACQGARESRPDPRGPYPDAGTGTVAREESEDGRLTVETATIRVNALMIRSPAPSPSRSRWPATPPSRAAADACRRR